MTPIEQEIADMMLKLYFCKYDNVDEFQKDAYTFARKVVEECVSEILNKNSPMLISHAYEDGYNNHRTQTLKRMEEILADNK